MGCNAIRTSHNPPAPELLDLCDRMGMVVMDESFDCWEQGKTPERLSSAVRRLAREGLARGTAPRPQSSLHHSLEHRQRSPRAGPAGRILDRGRVDRASPTRKTRRARHRRVQPHGVRLQRLSDERGRVWLQLQAVRIRQVPRRPIPACRSSAARPPPASARAANIFSPSAPTRPRASADFQMSSYDLYAPPWATTAGHGIHGPGRISVRRGRICLDGL